MVPPGSPSAALSVVPQSVQQGRAAHILLKEARAQEELHFPPKRGAPARIHSVALGICVSLGPLVSSH